MVAIKPRPNYVPLYAYSLWRENQYVVASAHPWLSKRDMHSEPSHEVVNKEIAYRWSQEELEMVYKIGFKPTDYLANK